VIELVDWCRSEVARRPSLTSSQAEALRRLVIVTPTRNRTDFLVRQAAFWGDTPARLLIMDGSDKAVSSQLEGLFGEYSNIEYRHEPAGWSARLQMAGEAIDRPYAVLCGDDEFLMPAGLASAIGLLDREHSMAGCIGQALGFYPTRRHRRLRFAEGYDYLRIRSTATDGGERILASMAEYDAATCYAVLRSDVWRESWGSVYDWSCPSANEVQQALAVHARGCLGVVDDLYWLRSMENSPVNRIERRFTLIDWWRSDEHEAEREGFVDCIARDLEAEGVALGADARRLVIQAVGVLVEAIDLRNETAGWSGGRPPERGRPRPLEMIRDLSNRFLPDVVHVALGDILESFRRLAGRSSKRRLGGIRRVERWCSERLLTATPEISEILGQVERTVKTFHRARVSD